MDEGAGGRWVAPGNLRRSRLRILLLLSTLFNLVEALYKRLLLLRRELLVFGRGPSFSTIGTVRSTAFRPTHAALGACRFVSVEGGATVSARPRAHRRWRHDSSGLRI